MFPRLAQWRGRALRLALALVVHVVALLIGFYLSPPLKQRPPQPELEVIMLPAPAQQQEQARSRSRPAETSAAETAPEPKPPASELDTTEAPLDMLIVNSDVYRAADISRIRSAPDGRGPAGDAPGGDSDPSIGRGPGGERLYAAQWYREPTSAEVNGYLPRNGIRSGHALIICRTIEDYRVEDCRELEEYPPGSGLARAMRQAAWQFRVRPPRIGGKPMVGTWVQIRFDLVEGFSR